MTDDEARELRDMVYQMHQALIGNGVEGCIPRLERCMTEQTRLTKDHDRRLTVMEGKVGVGQWVLMTVGGVFIACLCAGIWAIAAKV